MAPTTDPRLATYGRPPGPAIAAGAARAVGTAAAPVTRLRPVAPPTLLPTPTQAVPPARDAAAAVRPAAPRPPKSSNPAARSFDRDSAFFIESPGAAAPPPPQRQDGPDLEPDTLVPTQWQRSEDDYLDGRSDIGRAVGNHTRELFVTGDPGEALQEQFDRLRPSYIALHDLACLASRHLLHAVAAAAGQAVQRLIIRRQGFGTILAVIDYVDCPSEDHAAVRLYATDADEADTAVRHAIARVLLSRAALSVVMVGDLPAHALTEQLQPLRQALYSSDWECRHLVFLPLAVTPVATLTTLASAMGAGAGVHTQVGSVAIRPAEAWIMISTAWNEQQARIGEGGPAVPHLPSAAARDGLRPMPAAPGVAAAPPSPRQALRRFVEEIMRQPGVVAACLFDLATSKVLAHSGTAQEATDLARRGTLLMTAANTSRKQLSLPDAAEELIIKGGEQALGLRRLGSLPGLAVHVIYRPAQANWAQLRPKVMALDAAVPRGPVA